MELKFNSICTGKTLKKEIVRELNRVFQDCRQTNNIIEKIIDNIESIENIRNRQMK